MIAVRKKAFINFSVEDKAEAGNGVRGKTYFLTRKAKLDGALLKRAMIRARKGKGLFGLRNAK